MPNNGMQHQPEGPDRRKWHIKKEIALGDIVAFISTALAVVYAYTTLDKRVTILERGSEGQSVVDRKQDDEALRYQARIDKSMSEMNTKLDQMLLLLGGRRNADNR